MKIDASILEQTNPVYNTAKMTLFLLAKAGDADAAAIVDRLGLTQAETQNSATTVALPEQLVAGAINMDIRYHTMCRIAEDARCRAYVDLPCGYTPRAIQFSRKGLRYIGMDLPAAIAEVEPAITPMLEPGCRDLVRFAGVDATNYESLEAVLSGVEGPLCITTEGLLMYFMESEAGMMCDNIRRLMEKHGGVWFTADPENLILRLLVLQVMYGDRALEIHLNAKQQARDKSDVVMENNPLIIKFDDVENGTRAAMDFLKKHGLSAERIPLYDHLPELKSLSLVTPEQAEGIREAMKRYAYWKITPAGGAAKDEAADSKRFHFSEEVRDKTLYLTLFGKLDTITAPQLLAFYEQHGGEIQAVRVDCGNLDYISSAGLRVLMIMQTGCPEGVTLRGVNGAVREILKETGFDQALTVVD